MRRSYLVALAVLCGVLAGPSWAVGQALEAQPATQPAPAVSDVDALLVRAVSAYEASDYEGARALFEAVHARAPTARTLRGLALVAYKQQRFEAAVALFEASLAHAVKPLEGRLRDDALHLLEQARAQLPAQDEAAPPPEAGPPSIPDNERSAVRLAPAPAPRGLSTVARRAPAPQPSGASPSRRSLRLKRAGYGLLALSAATLLLTGTAWIIGLERLESIEEFCQSRPSGKCSRAVAEQRVEAKRLDLLAGLTTAGLVLGGVGAAGAATTLTLHYRGVGNDVAFGLSARGRF